jgi:hypothetical protein
MVTASTIQGRMPEVCTPISTPPVSTGWAAREAAVITCAARSLNHTLGVLGTREPSHAVKRSDLEGLQDRRDLVRVFKDSA